MTESSCLFCKIVSGAIDADKVYENDDVLAFRDINPQAPTHILVIPKLHVATLNDLEESDQAVAGALLLAARDLARQEGVADEGYRVVFNCNRAGGQTVFHVHMHLLGGRRLDWPPG